VAISYIYRLFQDASWGIRIDLAGDIRPGEALPPQALTVTEGVGLQVEVGRRLSDQELQFLQLGLRLVAPALRTAFGGKTPICVCLSSLRYNPTDYQPEGLAAAVAEWATHACGLPKPEIAVVFDRREHKYIFDWRCAAAKSASA
jgi:hypothetical protein